MIICIVYSSKVETKTKGFETSSLFVCSPSGELGSLFLHFTFSSAVSVACERRRVSGCRSSLFGGEKREPEIRLRLQVTADVASAQVFSPFPLRSLSTVLLHVSRGRPRLGRNLDNQYEHRLGFLLVYLHFCYLSCLRRAGYFKFDEN